MNIRKAFLHKAVPAACVLFAAGTIFAADRADLMGYVPGAEVMKVDVTDGRIDTISGIIYSQVKFPALVEDGKAAVRYLRAHADEYGIDPERIGVIGDSAGGYLVQMLGATNGEKAFDKGDFTNVSSDVQAVCTIYGISDLTSIGEGLDPAQAKVHASPAVTEALLVHGPAFGKSPGGSILSDREKAMNASSLGHIDGSEPPFLIMHGSGDRLVSPMQSAHLAQALRKAGTDVEYVLVEGAGHGDLPWFQKPVIERVVKFFEKRLGSPAKDAAEGNNL